MERDQLVFVTFYMKTMVPLRVVGILSNVAFLTYALIDILSRRSCTAPCCLSTFSGCTRS